MLGGNYCSKEVSGKTFIVTFDGSLVGNVVFVQVWYVFPQLEKPWGLENKASGFRATGLKPSTRFPRFQIKVPHLRFARFHKGSSKGSRLRF